MELQSKVIIFMNSVRISIKDYDSPSHSSSSAFLSHSLYLTLSVLVFLSQSFYHFTVHSLYICFYLSLSFLTSRSFFTLSLSSFHPSFLPSFLSLSLSINLFRESFLRGVLIHCEYRGSRSARRKFLPVAP